MKTLVQHLVANHLDNIVERSLLNCHAKGVHSIMLLESPEKTIRLFFAEKNSDIQYNSPHQFEEGFKLSVGFHSHHCNITLSCIKGEILNWIVKPTDVDDISRIRISKWVYHSKISNGEMGFESLGMDFLKTSVLNELSVGKAAFMNANEIHTVGASPNEEHAWFVFEGKEDENYESFCWSNSKLDEITSDGLYVKPTEEEVLSILMRCDLL